MTDPGLYMIMTRPRIGYRAFMELCVSMELPLVQLRDKSLSDGELLALSRELVAIRKGSNTRLIINDRVDIALLSGADGVHLGRDDIPASELEKLGFDRSRMILGLSSHSPAQAAEAWEQKPDYIGFGPVHPTPTKAIPDPAVGLEPIGEIVSQSPCPVILIGGLFPDNLDSVLRQGARNLCLVRYFNESENPRPRIEGVLDQIRRRTHDAV